MDNPIQIIKIEDREFALTINGDVSVIEFEGQSYTDMQHLQDAAQILSDSKHAKEFAAIANFLFTGLEFEIINDPISFKKEYQKIIDVGSNPYGLYDVTQIENAALTNLGTIVFFVQNVVTRVPYKVTCTYPYNGVRPSFSYQLLPEKNSVMRETR